MKGIMIALIFDQSYATRANSNKNAKYAREQKPLPSFDLAKPFVEKIINPVHAITEGQD
jgi:hypothetical protein